MKRLWISCMAMLLVICLMSGQAAAADSPAKLWRITMTARVLQNCEGTLLVQFYQPDNMKIQETDAVRPRYSFAIQPDMTWLDKDGKTIQPDEILTGQDIRLTFRYRVVDGQVQIDRALTARLLEELAAESIPPLTLPADTVVGTVVDKTAQTLTIYVEGGNLLFEGVMAHGIVPVDTTGAALLGADGKPVTAAYIQILDRVRLTYREAEWQESFPPQFGGGAVSSLRLLKEGETLLAPISLRATVTWASQPKEITNFRTIEKIRRYAAALSAGNGTTPVLASPIEVEFIENGETVRYVFLSSGHARRGGSDTWLLADQSAYGYLEGLFIMRPVPIIIN